MPELIVKEFDGAAFKTVGNIVFLGFECNFWSWSPYDKCSFRCVYCSVEAQGKSKPALGKQDLPALFEEFKLHQGKFPMVIGAPADAYPPEEIEHEYMREVIPLLKKHNIRCTIVTHGDIVARDIDLLVDCPSVEAVGVSIPHHDNDLIKQYESGAPTFEARLAAVYKLYDAGISVHVNVSPWIPGVTEPDEIAKHLPADIVVNVGALSYNHQHSVFTKHLFGKDIPCAEKVFGKQFASQQDINALFLQAHDQIRGGTKGNLRWLIPPGSGKNFTHSLKN
jgi:DNA repair photolyase